MFSLIQNEFIKLFARKKIWVFLIILLGITLVAGIGMRYLKGKAEVQDAEIALLSAQSFPLMLLDGLVGMLAIFIAILVADLITEEYVNGTLKLSLLRPIGRHQLLTAKMFVLALVILLMLLYSLGAAYVVGTVLLGWGDQFHLNGMTLSTFEGMLTVAKGYLVTILPVLAFGMVLMLFSLHLNSVGSTIGLGLAFFFISDLVSQLSATLRPYLLSTYFKYYQTVTTGNWKEILIGLVVIMVYGVLGYLLSLYSFRRKDILN